MSFVMLLFVVLMLGRIYNKGLFYCFHGTVTEYKSNFTASAYVTDTSRRSSVRPGGGSCCLRSIGTLRVSLSHGSAGSNAHQLLYMSIASPCFNLSTQRVNYCASKLSDYTSQHRVPPEIHLPTSASYKRQHQTSSTKILLDHDGYHSICTST